jgi:DNA-binding transcriptional regulator GbsR (MarR family)
MAVLKPRERLVYFRITEDEFHQFASVCEQEGARSISDLARSAVQRLIAECHREREAENLAPKMELLEKLIAEVTCQLQSLARLRARGTDTEDDTNGRMNGHTLGTKVADFNREREE